MANASDGSDVESESCQGKWDGCPVGTIISDVEEMIELSQNNVLNVT